LLESSDLELLRRLKVAMATMGPIIHGIGIWRRSNRKPAAIPTASALRIAGSRPWRLVNSLIDVWLLPVAVKLWNRTPEMVLNLLKTSVLSKCGG
jgi:hypothetical protein